MKALLLILTLCCFVAGKAQDVRTIVPEQPVILGNAFQVQYVVAGPAELESVTMPFPDSFQLVSGPHFHHGAMMIEGRTQQVTNASFTIVATATGKLRIAGAVAVFKNGARRLTQEAFVQVVPQVQASFNSRSNYTDVSLYAPSSEADLNRLIEENLFVKAEVDRKSCYLGEAIVASFKLYSRLQSSSEVVNSPSLYGFSAMDVLNINEAHHAVENLDGRIFNTAILRKLQLYPSQAGRLVIDPMELDHEIEFNDSAHKGKKIVVRRSSSTSPIEILVKDLPSGRPSIFTGAVGQFTIDARLMDTVVRAGEQGKLAVTISGQGNFLQQPIPEINWPKGFEVFEPEVTESLRRDRAPLQGSRKYMFSFVAYDTGSFLIEPILFCFFDPASGSFHTIHTLPLHVKLEKGKAEPALAERGQTKRGKHNWLPWILSLSAAAAVAGFFLLRRRPSQPAVQTVLPARRDFVQEIMALEKEQGEASCLQLQKILEQASGSYGPLDRPQQEMLEGIIRDCQLMAYAPVEDTEKRQELIARAAALIKQLHSAYL